MLKEISKISDDESYETVPPKVIAAASNHYSIPKAVSLLGLGEHSLEVIPTDENSRIEIHLLREKLETCLRNRIPVIAFVGMLASTAENAVDPLDEIVALRR